MDELSNNVLNLAEGRSLTVWAGVRQYDLSMIEVRNDVLIGHTKASVRATVFIPVNRIDAVEIREGLNGEPLYVLRPRGHAAYDTTEEEVAAYPVNQKRADELNARRRRGEDISAEDSEFMMGWEG